MDDAPDQMRSIIEDAMRSFIPEQLLTILDDGLARLRPEILNALSYALRSPLDCDSVELLATAAGLSSRALRGEITAAGFAPPRTWLVAARVLRAHWEFRRPSVKVHNVMANMGYSSDVPLAHDIARMTGLTASEFRRLSTRDLLSTIAHRLTQPFRRNVDATSATCIADHAIHPPLASAG
jgi:AraC-like DNA-binding protein